MNVTEPNAGGGAPLIDLKQVPNPLLRAAMPILGAPIRRLLAIDAINEVHQQVILTATSETFFTRILEILGCRYQVSETDLDRIPETGPVVVVSNHPLGGLDGVILGDLLRRRRKDVKVMANYLLRKVRFAEEHMIFVDPFDGSQASRNIAPLRQCLAHLKAGGLLAVFPGNKVSHYQWHRGEVADPEWVPHIASLIRRTGASALPVFIAGGNSRFFNLAGLLHASFRTALLPREFVRRGRTGGPIRVHIGTMIPAARLSRFATDQEMIRFLRINSYFLGNRPTAEPATLSTAFAEKQKRAEPVASPLPPGKLEADIRALPPEACLVRKGDCEVYLATYEQIPHVMQEIGRGREISFRSAGGGALTALDLAPQDRHYRHLFLWNKTAREVIGGYRIGLADEIIATHGHQGLICNTLFQFKPEFVKKLNPGLELGRSYILPSHQKSYGSLLLLWAGILQFIARNPRYNIIFGSVAMTHGPSYAPASRTLLVNYLRQQHGSPSLSILVKPEVPFQGVRLHGLTAAEISELLHDIEDVSTLVTGLETDGRGVPILFKHYVRMNAKLLDFGMWTNHGNSVIGLMIADLATADPKFLRRYMGDDGYEEFRRHHGMPDPLLV